MSRSQRRARGGKIEPVDERVFELSPDSRTAKMLGGIDEQRHPILLTPHHLEEQASSWSTSADVPEGIAELLRVSRQLFVHGFFVYEFITIGAMWSLLAVEGALRLRLDSEATFAARIRRARELGYIAEETAAQVDAGRELRNEFAHPTTQIVWTLGMAAPVIAASHKLVADLFPEGATTDTSVD